MEYKLIEVADSAKTLSEIVTGHLYDSWKLYGNPFAYVLDIGDNEINYYCQAVTRDLPVHKTDEA